MADLSELDNLLAELDHIEAPKKATPAPTTIRPAAPTTTTTTSTPKPAPAPSVSQPKSTPTPNPAPSAKPNQPTAKRSTDWDELDALVAKFDTKTEETTKPPVQPTPTPSVTPTPKQSYTPPAPKTNTTPAPAPTTKPYVAPKSSNQTTPLDLNSLPSADEDVSYTTKQNPTTPPATTPSAPAPKPYVPPSSPRGEENSNRRMTVISTAAPNSTDICGNCGQRVTGEHLTAMNKKWHMNHFKCSDCKTEIFGDFYEYEKQPKCKSCFETKYVCSKCGLPISGEYYVGGGKLLHASCIDRHVCGKCHMQIEATSRELQALDKYWHPNCFVCTACGSQLSGSFYNIQEMPYCDDCAQSKTTQSQGNCGGCGKGITGGTFITYKDTSYHSECFVCFSCKNVLDHSSFYDVNGKVLQTCS